MAPNNGRPSSDTTSDSGDLSWDTLFEQALTAEPTAASEDGARPAAQPAAARPAARTVTARPAGAASAGRDEPTVPKGHRRVLVVAAVVVVLAGGGVAAALATRHTSHSVARGRVPTTAPGPSGPGTGHAGPHTDRALVPQHALAWLVAQLPRSSAVLTDDTTATAIGAAGFAKVTSEASVRSGWIISTPALRALPGSSLHARIAAGVPVASFGSGRANITVERVSSSSARATAAAIADDAATRRSAGQALVRNPRITAGPAVRDRLEAGELDLRAATFLALLAQQTRVRVVAVHAVAAETAAHRPARTLTVRTSDTTTDVQDVLRTLPGQYLPTSVHGTSATTITWPVSTAFIEPQS